MKNKFYNWFLFATFIIVSFIYFLFGLKLKVQGNNEVPFDFKMVDFVSTLFTILIFSLIISATISLFIKKNIPFSKKRLISLPTTYLAVFILFTLFSIFY